MPDDSTLPARPLLDSIVGPKTVPSKNADEYSAAEEMDLSAGRRLVLQQRRADKRSEDHLNVVRKERDDAQAACETWRTRYEDIHVRHEVLEIKHDTLVQ